ncbi:hypothetical protein [Streptomyces sp. NPDC048419]|uniref:hypothetical protein n=1 Tax=Streptomyces sp. NPDC048419 TaxID=3365547 RepID=UPI003716CCC9
MLTAPIVPTLGPVHPHALTAGLFEDIRTAAATDRNFLHYDKDRCWSREKDEAVLTDGIVHQPDRTLVPTLSGRGRGTIKVFAYCHQAEVVGQAAELASKLAAEHGVVGVRVVRPLGPEAMPTDAVRIQLHNFAARSCHDPGGPVRPYSEWPAAVLTAVLDDRVVGAFGPVEIRRDAVGHLYYEWGKCGG